jgi:hypothetical protein
MMTEQPTPPADAVPPPLEVQPDAGTSVEASSVDDNPNHEAARWRIKYREAEAQNAALAAQLDAVRTDQANAYAAAAGITAKALWASGAQLPELLDDAGVVDPDKVAAAAVKARSELGIAAKSRPRGIGLSGAMPPQPPRDQWREAFTPRRHREPD